MSENSPLPVKGYTGQSDENVALANKLKEAEERYLRELGDGRIGMAHQVLERLPRNERRVALKKEASARTTGDWGPWETLTFPRGSAGMSWAAEFTKAHRNRVFSVLDRTLANGVRHLAVTSLSQQRPSWPEMQRIKDDLAGAAATAVEVYPPKLEIVDGADMYHIWILTEPLPFGLCAPKT